MVEIQKSQFKISITTISLEKRSKIIVMAGSNSGNSQRKLPKNLRYPRRAKVPVDIKANLYYKKKNIGIDDNERFQSFGGNNVENDEEEEDDDDGEVKWSTDELETISSLFQGRIPQKPGNLNKERPLPLPIPYTIRPLGFPTSKKHVRRVSPQRKTVCDKVYKNPTFLVHLAKEIKDLPAEKDVSEVLNKWVRFLRKGSLSLTIRELGHMNLPERALQTFSWAEKHPHLFPDDRILGSTVEILARTRQMKMPFDLEKFTVQASRSVIEAMARGFIRGGSFSLARKLLMIARDNNRKLDPSIHAKFILELVKNPDKYKLVSTLLTELAEMEEMNLSQQDCTAVMKVCIRLGKFEIVEILYNWFKESGRDISVVMYTTLIHSRYCENNYREALAVVWEMEQSNCLFDLPAYRVVIKLFVALNDISRAVRYFSRLKEAGFTPTYDVYRDLVTIYAASGRLAKCKEVCKEVEMAGFKLDDQTASLLLEMGIEDRYAM
ncbi:hypothetical protein AQUCO_01500345v1 [Aquilegia coerulea]|uniref:Pentacotripeptide-repeat region of PRORP domain-containing protein n=1 Tax=Aquilegia coerulea TaxID=218851 RepID=A0A2G5DT80_AQUCA|nr:hypothetical protein AQUCO_01500345v1 [Aquilegia coerulea]